MKKLTYTQRLTIAEGIRQNKSNAQIAREIGVHRSTVGREIERNAGSREAYAALEANDKSWRRQQAAVPKRRMLFGGVDFFTKLQKHDTIYIYYSRTHRNRLSRFQRYESFFKSINCSTPGYLKSEVHAKGGMPVFEKEFISQKEKEFFILPLLLITPAFTYSPERVFILPASGFTGLNNLQNFYCPIFPMPYDHLRMAS